ncbi:glycerol-3-phosphate 1-O-acyltransferase PlsY [Verrucomicrobia bacterium]|nr:glycerol-3-phosphate 1-O-acyltransferase PlsY [Verrucomicrobiota bacterium]
MVPSFNNIVMVYFLAALTGFLLGSIPTGFLVARQRGVDIRSKGSGNIGATNVFRNLGWKAGTFVLLMDAFKGWLGCRCAVIFLDTGSADPVLLLIAGGFASVLGHNYTPWLRFKGGKGIATSAGVLIALTPWGFLTALLVFLMAMGFSRYVSLGSIMAGIVLPVVVWGRDEPKPILYICILMGTMAVIKHRTNIGRIITGQEPRIGDAKSKGKGEKTCR